MNKLSRAIASMLLVIFIPAQIPLVAEPGSLPAAGPAPAIPLPSGSSIAPSATADQAEGPTGPGAPAAPGTASLADAALTVPAPTVSRLVRPDEAASIELAGVRLELPEGAVTEPTTISITCLNAVADTGEDLSNVTSGAASSSLS